MKSSLTRKRRKIPLNKKKKTNKYINPNDQTAKTDVSRYELDRNPTDLVKSNQLRQ